MVSIVQEKIEAFKFIKIDVLVHNVSSRGAQVCSEVSRETVPWFKCMKYYLEECNNIT